jgi:T5SS/PEP-CTERM-associated repeat protein
MLKRQSIVFGLVASAVGLSLVLPETTRAAIIETGDVVNTATNKIVGDTGVGSYTVDGGSNAVLTSGLTFGNQSTGDGTGLITGTGSSLGLANSFLNVGVAGQGTLTIADGASVSTTSTTTEGSVNIGATASGTGELTVTGAATSLTAAGPRFWVGNGTLNIEDGATVNALSQTYDGSIFYIGSGANSNGTVNVRSGATLDTTTPTAPRLSLLLIGQDGSGELNIESGGQVLAEDVTINLFTSATSVGTINVSGPGSLLSSTRNIRVKAALPGAVASLNLSDDATVSAQGYLAIGDLDDVNAYAGTSQADISSGGSVDLGASLYVGFYSPSAMNVSDASITADLDLYVGIFDTGILTLSDANVAAGRNVFVGYAAPGTMTVSGGSVTGSQDLNLGNFGTGMLTISEGGTVGLGDDVYIARENGTGAAIITGAGSTLTTADRLWVGWGSGGAPANATLEVGRGGLVEALTNNASSGSGLGLAIGPDDIATLRFMIGDDGNGNIASGLIDTGAFFFGSGTALLDLAIDPGVSLILGDVFTLIDYDSWDGNFFANIGDDSLFSVGAFRFLIDYDDDLGGGNLALTATLQDMPSVPEPGSLVLVASCLALVSLRRRPAGVARARCPGGPSGRWGHRRWLRS